MKAVTPSVVRALRAAMAFCGIFGLPLINLRNSTNSVETAAATCSGRCPGVSAWRRRSASSEPWFGPLTEVIEATCPGASAAA
ncbi:hypothetical protein D3C81_1821860 [compost metagenome]